MTAILISIDANSANATAGIDKVSASLTGLDRSMGQTANSSTRMGSALSAQERALGSLDSAQARLESRIIRQNSLFDQMQRAIEANARAQGILASGVDTSASAVTRAESTFTRMISTQERYAMSVQQTANAYRTLAGAQDSVGRAGDRVAGAGSAPEGGGSGGGGKGFGDTFLGSLLKYQLGFSALSQVTTQLTDAFTRTLSTQRTLAMTQATTGISQQTTDALGQYIQQQAGSGKQPFTSDVLSSGLYAIPSAGVTDPTAIKAINDIGVKISAFTGSTDTGTVNTALIQTMTELGYTDKQMTAQVGKVGDVITGIINLGIVAPNQVAPNVATFGSTAAQYGVDFGESGGIFAALTKTTRSADLAALDTSRIFSSIGAPNKQQQKQAAELGGSDLLGQAGIARLKSDPGGYLREVAQITRLNPAADIAGIFGNRNAVQGIMGLTGPDGANIAGTLGTIGKVSAAGSTDQANTQYENSAAAKMDNASAQFKTSVDQFAASIMPGVTALLGGATSAVNAPGWAGHQLDIASYQAHKDLAALGIGQDSTRTGIRQVSAGRGSTHAGQWFNPTTGLYYPTQAEATAATSAVAGPTPAVIASIMADTAANTPQAGQSLMGGRNSASAVYAARQDDTLTAQRQALRDRHAAPGSGGSQHIAVTDAQDRLTLAIQGFGDKTKALGIYERAVQEATDANGNPLYSPVKRKLMDLAAEQSVGANKAGPAVKPFTENNPGLGGLAAGRGGTAVRFGGGVDPVVAENRKLREELKTANGKVTELLGQIAGYLKPSGNTTPPNALTVTGSNRGYRGRG